MKKLLKSNRGIALGLVLVVMMVLVIFSMVVLNMATTDTFHASIQSDNIKAYYLARSAVDAMAAYFVENPENLASEQFKNRIEDIINFGNSSNCSMPGVSVNVEYDPSNPKNLIVTGEGKFNNSIKIVTQKIIDITKSVEFNKAIYSTGLINISGGTINGPIAGLGEIKNSGWPTIGTKFEIFKGPSANPIGWSPAIKISEIDSFSFPEFPFPIFPGYPTNIGNVENKNIIMDWNTKNDLLIASDTWYKGNIVVNGNKELHLRPQNKDLVVRIKDLLISGSRMVINEVSSVGNTTIYLDNMQINNNSGPNLLINLGDYDVNIFVQKLNLKGSITVNRKINGKGKLNIHVQSMDASSGSGMINNNTDKSELNSHENVYLYYHGPSTLTIAGSVRISSNLFIKNANLNLSGGGCELVGNIISNRGKIDIGGGNKAVTTIYAPLSVVNVTNGRVEGSIISQSTLLSGGGVIEYKEQSPFDKKIFKTMEGKLEFDYGIWN